MAAGEKRWETWIQMALGVVIALLGWSLSKNVEEFGKKLDVVAADVSRLTASVATHDKDIGKLEVRLGAAEHKIDGIEDRERERLAGGK